MKDMMLILVSAAMLTRISYVISERNIGAWANGYGCIQSILDKSAKAPMSNRVLMALLLKKIPQSLRLFFYFFFFFVGVFSLLLTCKSFFGLQFALALVVLIPFTIRYDYWDWIPELGAVVSCASGNATAAVIWCFFSALSRETSLVMPIVWATSGHDVLVSAILTAEIFFVFALVRKWQGEKEKYCEAIMLDRNGKELKEWLNSSLIPIKMVQDVWQQKSTFYNIKLKTSFDDMTSTVAITIASIFCIAHFGLPFSMPIMLFLVAGWTFAIARETRVFAPILMWIALWISSCNR